MRAKPLPVHPLLLAILVVAFVTPVAAQEVGELIPVEDPSEEDFAVIEPFLPGPVQPPEEPPSQPVPLTEQQDLLNETPRASETGAHNWSEAAALGGGGAIFSARGGGRGVSQMQVARRSLKLLIRQLG